MKIFHYTLGVPPKRRGGLVKYVDDLAKAQAAEGHEIFIIYPGENYIFNKSKHDFFIKKVTANIVYGFFSNPTPMPIYSGVSDPDNFLKHETTIEWSKLSNLFSPDIIHVHTLLGINKSFFNYFNRKNIPIVYTTHDHYGICLRMNMQKYNGTICNTPLNSLKCSECNFHALNTKNIIQKNYKLYHSANVFRKKFFNNNGAVRFVLNKISKSQKQIENAKPHKLDEYSKLMNYFYEIFKRIDFIHFNSHLVKKSFQDSHILTDGEIIPIIHADIQDRRSILNYTIKNKIRFGFIGSERNFKLVLDALHVVKEYGFNNWQLNVFGNGISFSNVKNITFNGSYKPSQLQDVFKNIDVLLIPSLWKETFSFIGLEALSFGIPVIVSSNVGLKSIIEMHKTGFVIENSEFKNVLIKLLENPSQLEVLHRNILNMPSSYFEHKNHVQRILNLYKNLLRTKY